MGLSSGKPKPFKRQSVDLGGPAAAKKNWQQVTADKLSSGDIVADFGQIAQVERSVNYSHRIMNVVGDVLSVPEGQTVFAFTSN